MASTLGGWYLNGSTLEYRLFKEDGVTLSTTVIAKITGWGNYLRKVDNDATDIQIKVKNDSGTAEWTDLNDENEKHVSITAEEKDVTSGTTTKKEYEGTITIGDVVLDSIPSTITLANSNGGKFTLALAEADEHKVKIAGAEDFEYDKTGKLTVKADLTAGFKLSGNTATYYAAKSNQTLATVTGLRTNVKTEYAVYSETNTTGTAKLTPAKETRTGTITLSKIAIEGAADGTDTTSEGSVLGTSNISITTADVAKTQGINYYLALDASKEGLGYAQQDLDTYEPAARWTYSGTTAKYNIESPTGYELTNAAGTVIDQVADGGDKNATKIKVTAKKTTNVVTVSGLAKDLDVSEDGKKIGTYTFSTAGTATFKEGLTVNEIAETDHPTKSGNTTTKGNVTVNIKDNNVITNTTVSLSSSSYTPKFGEVNNVLKVEDIKDIWEINGTTATLKRVRRAWYKPEGTEAAPKLTYAGQTTLYTFLTITGLSAEGLDKATKTTTASDNYEPAVITAIDGLTVTGTLSDLVTESTDNNGLKKYTKNANATDLGITISTALLDTNTAKIGNSDKFKITLADDFAAPTFSDMQWNVESNGTKAILKGDITKGYVVKADGKSVTYTKSGDNQTLATITGLKKGTKLTVGNSDARTVGFGGGSSFKQGLSLATNDALSSNNPVDFSTVAGLSDAYNRQSIIVSKNVIDTSKVQINSSFFDLELAGDGAVGGAVPTEAGGASTDPYWTLGTTAYLKTGYSPYYSLAANHLSIDYKNPATGSNKADTITTVKGLNANVTVEDLVVDGTTIKVNANALDNKNVTITNPTNATDKYKLQLVGGDAPTITSPEWKQTGNTVTYAADVKSGYRTSNDGSAIIYNPTKETTLFTITGLRSGVGTVKDGEGKVTGLSGIVLNENNRTVELSYGVLNNANVTLKSDYGYDLLVNSDIKTVAPGSTASIASWAIEGTTATYKAIIPAYYEYNPDKDTLIYHKATDAKEGSKTVTYAKITGLSKGLFVSEDGQSIGYYKDDGAFVAGLSAAGTEANLITIKDAGILSTVAAKLDNAAIAAGYSLALDSTLENNIKPKFVDNFSDTDATWTVKGTTAYLLGGVSAGWVTSEDKKSILYYAGNDTAATIATVKNLPSGLTTKKVTAEGGLAVAGHSITVGENVLATNTKLSLTTNIPVGNENYYFALADDVTDYNDAVLSLQKVWTIKDSTATYRGSIGSAYYGVVGSASDSISYNAAGLPDDLQYAKLEGLASNLVTIQGGAIKGISVAELAQGNGFNHKIELSSNVLKAASVTLNDLNPTDTLTFGLSTAEDVLPPQDAAGLRVESAGNLALYKGKTSGYTLSGATLLAYDSVEAGSGSVLAKISGLASTFKSSGTAISPSNKVYEDIDGISVNYSASSITLSKDILGSTSVTFTENAGKYTFALDSDVATYSSGAGWVKGNADGQYVLYSGTSKGGFSLAGDSLSVKMMAGGGTGGTTIGTISGLKKNLTINDKYQIAGISFGTGDDKTIYLSQNVLDGKDVTINLDAAGTGYKLALNKDETDEAAYVAAPVTTNLWTLNNGTATYEQKTTAGYTTDDNTTIKYTKAQTITTKIDNLSKEYLAVTEEQAGTNKLKFTGAVATAESGDEVGEGSENNEQQAAATVNEAITFDSGTGKFTIKYADVLAHKDSSIKVSYSTGLTDAEKDAHKYTLNLPNSIAAKSDDPVWVKSNKETTAKLNQTTAAGYTLALDGSKVTYSSDPTTKTLATISNLKRDVALNENGTIDDDTDSTYGLSYALATEEGGNGTIKVYKGVLDVLSGSNTVKLADSDNFEFALDNGIPQAAEENKYAFTVSGTKATYKKGKSAFYNYKGADTATPNKKQIAYTPADMSTEAEFTIEGLKSGTKANADGTITGIDVNGTSVTLSQAVLDKSKVYLTTSGSYVLALGDDVHDYSKTTDGGWKDQTEWISSGSTYTYKTYDKASYELYTNTKNQTTNQRSITYHGETSGTEHAKITGLKSGLTITTATNADDTGKIYKPNDFDNPDLGGTITLSDNELNKAKVTLTTKGDTKIKLALKTADLKATATPDSSWTTSGTKATLGGTLSKGYTVSEDEKSITYNSAKKSQTFATITGIKSGAKIKAGDFVKDATTGVTTVTLGADQVGTSDIKITGDGYKLDVENDIKSTTDAPKWIKTAGNNKATYTQTTYNGFKVENSGKTLKYYKNTTNVDLVTINGLKSDLVAASGEITGVTRDDTKKVITLSADALAKSNVSLTSKEGDYSLALNDNDSDKLKVKGTTESKISYNTFKDGTLSRVSGITEGWTRESPTLIKYTAPKIDTLVTISGLNKNATFNEYLENPTQNEIAGVTFDGNDTFTLSKTALETLTDGKSVTLTNKTVNGTASTFKLAIDNDTAKKPEDGDNELALNGTTAYLKATKTAGYEVTGDNKITYRAKKQDETLATITGLPSGCKLEQNENGKNIITLDGQEVLSYNSGSQVQVNSDFLNSHKKAITLKIVDTKSDFGASFNDVDAPGVGADPDYNSATTFSNGTMTYKAKYTAGWEKTPGNDGITTYQYKTDEVKTIATVAGLNPSITGTGATGGVNVDNGEHVVTVGPNALNNKKVTISVPNGSDKYTLAIEDDVYADGQEEDKWKNQVEWVMSNGTASYKLYDKGHYKVNGTSTAIDYTAANAGTTYASITGLTKTATIDSDDVNENGVITLTSTDLGASTVKLTTSTAAKATTTITSDEGVLDKIAKAPNFILDLKAGDVDESRVKDAAWDTTGTTAKLVGTVTKGYILSTDKKSVTYQAADQDGKEIAKITGLRSGAEVTADDVSVDSDDVRISNVTLDAYDFGTGNVAITGAGYKLVLGDKVIKSADVDKDLANGGWKEQTDWTASNGTFTYKTYNKANWELNDTGTSVKYTAAKDVTNGTKLTITGLNPDVITQDVDRYISSNTADNIVKIDDNNNQVTLGAKALNRKTITLSDKSGDGYTLANIDGNKSTASNLTGVVSGSKVTVRGTQSQGYLLSNDSQKLTYYAKATTQDVAVINGLTTTTYAASLKGSGAVNLEFSSDTNTFTLKDGQLSDSVTVSGSARFSFDDSYTEEKKIFGTSNSENIKVAGSGLTVNAGSGNDYIDLGSNGTNTVIYGGGNDVIANFGTDDTFKANIDKSNDGTNLTFLDDNNDDAILKIGSNKVRFKGLAGTVFSIFDKSGSEEKKVTHAAGNSNGDVLADDNYSTTPQLSSIVNNSSGYMMTDDLTATDATSLTKQNTAIAYSGKK